MGFVLEHDYILAAKRRGNRQILCVLQRTGCAVRMPRGRRAGEGGEERPVVQMYLRGAEVQMCARGPDVGMRAGADRAGTPRRIDR